MLIHFEVSNYRSFRETVHLTLEPSREKLQRSVHVHESGDTSVLRLGLIYGTNSSGKSNLFKAVDYAKNLITRGTAARKTLQCPKFKLDADSRSKPSRFLFKFHQNCAVYTYEFQIGHEDIIFEELKVREEGKREQRLFSRSISEGDDTRYTFGKFAKELPKKDRQLLQFVSKGTRTNQLFLYESIERNVEFFRPAFDWFDKAVRVFTPQSISHGVEFQIGSDDNFTNFLKENLRDFDPSVVDIETSRVKAASVADIPVNLLSDLSDDLNEASAALFANPHTGQRFVLLPGEDGELDVLKIHAKHQCADTGDLVAFELDEESDGTRRFLELAPLIYELMNSDETIVAFIDELDRSFHSGLTQLLMSKFLRNDSSRRSQILATTHEDNLMENESLKRRDIWWIIDKREGVSSVTSLKEYNPRHDKDIRKSYIRGEFGGVPNTGVDSAKRGA